MKKRTSMAAGLGLVLAIAGMMAVPAMAEELTPVTIYGVTDPQISAQQIIAKEKGFFEEQGLDVTNVLIESSGDLPSYIASGEAPVSCESTYTCTEMAVADVPMKMLTSTTDIGGTQGVVAGPDFEVTSAKDLEGCTMGMMNGSGVYIAVRNMAEQMGIDWTKINVVYLSPSEQIAALANGSIDIMACWEPHISTAVEQGGKLLFTGSKSYLPDYEGDVDWLKFYSTLQVTKDFYDNNYDTCVKLVKAFVEATDYINENMEECAGIIAEQINNDKDNVYDIMQKNTYVTLFDDDFAKASQTMAEYMNEMGNIDSVPDFDSYGDPSVLKEVLPEAATYEPGTIAELEAEDSEADTEAATETTTEETTEAATEAVTE